MKKILTLFSFFLLTQVSCTVSDPEIESETNVISIDDKKYELSEFITPDEKSQDTNGYSIESWMSAKSIILDEKNCDFSGEGYGTSLFFYSSSPNSIDPGIYKIVDSSVNNRKKNEAGGELDFFSKSINNEEDLVSGSIEVIRNNFEYTIKLEAITEKSKKIKLFYKGSLKILNC